MFCPNCGTANEDSSRFCAHCGAELSAPAPVTPPEPAQPASSSADTAAASPIEAEVASAEASAAPVETAVISAVPEQTPLSVAAVMERPAAVPAEVSAAPYLPDAPAATLPQKHRAAKWIALAACLAIVLGMAGTTYWFWPNLKMLVMEPSKYYLMAETETITTGLNALQEDLKLDMEQPYSASGTYGLDLSGLQNAPQELLDVVNKIKLNVVANNDPAAQLSSISGTLQYDNQTIMEVLQNQTEKALGISLPGLVDGQLVMPSSRWMARLLLGEEDELQALTGMKKKELSSFVTDFVTAVVLDSFTEEDIVQAKGSYEGQSCSTTEFILNQAVLRRMAAALADQLENNPRVASVCKAAIHYAEARYNEIEKTTISDFLRMDSVTFPSDAEIDDALKSAAAELKQRASTLELPAEETYHYTVYYAGRGQLIARTLTATVDDVAYEMKLAAYRMGDEHVQALEFHETEDGETRSAYLRNRCTESKGTFKGTAAAGGSLLNSEKNEIFTMSYEGSTNTKIGGVNVFVGTIQETVYMSSSQANSITCSLTSQRGEGDSLATTLSVKIGAAEESQTIVFKGNTTLSSIPKTAEVAVAETTTMTEDAMASLPQALLKRAQEVLGEDVLQMFGLGGSESMSPSNGDVDDTDSQDDAEYAFDDRVYRPSSAICFRKGTDAAGEVVLASQHLEGIQFFFDENNEYAVQFHLTNAGRRLLFAATTELMQTNGSLSLWVGDTQLFSASIEEALDEDSIVLSDLECTDFEQWQTQLTA